MLSADSHLDLGKNALEWKRDLTLPVTEIRRLELEEGSTVPGAGRNTVSLPAMRQANLFLSLATVRGQVNTPANKKRGFHSPEQAYAAAMAHVCYYRVLETEGQVRIVDNRMKLDSHVAEWEAWEADPGQTQPPLGFVISAEGADPIIGPHQVETWWLDGLRVVSLVHYGVGPYAHGHNMAGGLTPAGRELLAELDRANIILDITHLSDQAFWEAVDLFGGKLLASHHNCRALVPNPRQLADEQIHYLIQRDGVIGVAFDNWMLHPDWPIDPVQPGANEWVSLEHVVDHIDHICKLAGNAGHAALGTDLDGGYGTEQTPGDLDTIADVQVIPDLLRRRGYSMEDIEAIMYKNWLRLLRSAWE